MSSKSNKQRDDLESWGVVEEMLQNGIISDVVLVSLGVVGTEQLSGFIARISHVIYLLTN